MLTSTLIKRRLKKISENKTYFPETHLGVLNKNNKKKVRT